MSAQQDVRPTRRGFLARIGWALGAVALAEGSWVGLSFLRPRGATSTPPTGSIVVLGPVDRFEPGSVTAFPEGRFYLARLAQGGFLAIHRECTHLGCTVPWVPDQLRFVCPCHASAFDIHGDVVSPPATRPLDLFEVRIENGVVKVNTARILRRRSFEASQVVSA